MYSLAGKLSREQKTLLCVIFFVLLSFVIPGQGAAKKSVPAGPSIVPRHI
jgi:hypothetical protein